MLGLPGLGKHTYMLGLPGLGKHTYMLGLPGFEFLQFYLNKTSLFDLMLFQEIIFPLFDNYLKT